MKEKIFKILHNRKRMPGERFSDIEGKIENLVNQEVEKRIAERIDRFDVVYDFGEAHRNLHLKTQKLKWSGALWMFEWLRSRLTCSEKPNNSQKTEGGEG